MTRKERKTMVCPNCQYNGNIKCPNYERFNGKIPFEGTCRKYKKQDDEEAENANTML